MANERQKDIAIVIMAGGGGTRFWPASRKDNPKQFLRLLSDKSLFQETVRRVLLRYDYSQIFILATEAFRDKIIEETPEIPEENYILEPDARSTAACIGLAAYHLKAQMPKKFEDVVMAVLSADHLIAEEELFHSKLETAIDSARNTSNLVTLGIVPTRPETGYGYIHLGPKIGEENGNVICKVLQFVEKPDRETAKKYVESKEYLWNSGMFIWKASRIAKSLAQYMPRHHQVVKGYGNPKLSDRDREGLDQQYSTLDRIAVEHGIMEVDPEVAVVPMDIVWDDLGDWASLGREKVGKGKGGNVVFSKGHFSIDSKGAIVHAPKKLVATIGVKDVIVVDMDDVLLICSKDQAQDVKKMVQKLHENGMDEYL